jgi:hypothetical protein
MIIIIIITLLLIGDMDFFSKHWIVLFECSLKLINPWMKSKSQSYIFIHSVSTVHINRFNILSGLKILILFCRQCVH